MWTSENYQMIYERYQSSGLSVLDFCFNERITRSRFYYWLKKMRKLYKSKTSDATLHTDKVKHGTVHPVPASCIQTTLLTAKDKRNGKDKAPGFIPLVLSPGHEANSFPLKELNTTPAVGATSSSESFMEISYPNGVCIRLSGAKDMELIKTIILLSRSCDV